MGALEIDELKQRLRRFAAERDWDQYHTPKNLATALVCEAAELVEIFQWMTAEESARVMEDERLAREVRHELADILVYCVRLADKLDVDLAAAVDEKLEINAGKYPVEKARGNATKYSRRGEE